MSCSDSPLSGRKCLPLPLPLPTGSSNSTCVLYSGVLLNGHQMAQWLHVPVMQSTRFPTPVEEFSICGSILSACLPTS